MKNKNWPHYSSKEIEIVSKILKSGKVTNSTYKNLWDTISKGKTWSGELFNKKKDDLLYWDYTVISPIFGESGEIVNYIATKEEFIYHHHQLY
mgnify:CR=1 FL=1